MTDTFVVRQLENSDLPEAANILVEGFPRYSLAFWQKRLRAMTQRERAPGTPIFGYGLDVGSLQGVVLTFGSSHGPPKASQTIVNISSWTVRPTLRGAAAFELYRRAANAGDMTFSNLSAAAHTVKTIKKLGFTQWTAGQIAAAGVARSPGARRRIVPLGDAEREGLSPERAAMMRYHQARGCLVFCLEGNERLAPFMFLPRRVKGVIPLAQLIYCERLSDFIDNSRTITLEILKRGYAALLVDASGPIEGLVGRYFPGQAPKYYKGAMPIYAIDHSYSEMIYIGF
jgi:hypothetical protein